jgi:ATP-binding cassette subfamily B protein
VLSLRKKIRRGFRQLPHLGRGLELIWRATPGWTLTWIILLIIQGLLPVATVYLTRLLVDSLVAIVGQKGAWDSIRPSLMWIALMALVFLAKELLRGVSSYIRINQSEWVRDYITGLIHHKSMEIDLEFYDSPDYYDRLHRARSGAAYRPMALLESTGILLQNGITLASMLFVLAPYGLWLPLALLISTLPVFYVVLQHRLRYHQWIVKNTAEERRAWYYDWLLTARETAAELRLFQLSRHFQSAFQLVRKRLRLERSDLARDQGVAEFGAGFAALLVTGLSMAWMVWRAILGEVSLGDLALFYQAFNQGQSLMRSFLENAGEIYSNSFFLGDLFDFLELESRLSVPVNPASFPGVLRTGIRFEKVTFCYPQSDIPAIQEFDLEISAGQIIAIVGPNGAGKSTLVKLLCRFYDPQAGSVTIDGIDLREFSIRDLREHISMLFQEPVHFSATVRENIALGDMDTSPEMNRIITAAESAGADAQIQRLKQGYETLLGKWFEGGTDLSVGEWQRLSLARAFLRRGTIIVLDEPTSSMDPWAEADWLARMRRLAAGCTAILITHRFTTAAHADIIYVMDQGRIVEYGSHQELLAQGGRYASSWREQMRVDRTSKG